MAVETHHRVVIVGAGPVGVTAATLLAQYGIDSLLLEKWAQVYPRPRAVHIDDEVFRILDRLGIADEFTAISLPARGLRLLAPDLRVLAEFRRDPAATRHGHPQANMFDQPELEALLRGNLDRHPGVTLRGDADVTGLTALADGRTRVRFTDRRDGAEQTVVADYLLGCDGANSQVRNHIGARMRDLRFEQRWLVIDIDTDTDLHQWQGVHQVCDTRRAATFMQVGKTRYRWEFRLLDDESADDFPTVNALRPLIEPWLGEAADADLHLVRVADYTFRAQLADRWRRGNTFLLGDAAHLTPPFIGQGLGAGLRDAMNLAWKLAGVIDGGLPPSALDSYETERQPHARAMILLALGVGHAMTAGGRVGSALRGLIAPHAQSIPGLSRRLLDSATPRLHDSALVRRRSRRDTLVGSLFPNAPSTDGRRWDTLCRNGFAVITTTPPTDGQRAAIERRGVVVHYAEPGSPLGRWLRDGKASAAVVRPDFTVMCAGDDLQVLCASLPTRRGH